MNYLVQFTPEAFDDLAGLDTTIARRIAEKIQRLADNFDLIQPEPLIGRYAHLFKLRVGDWRVLYTFDSVQHCITIHVIAHRSKVYKF